MMCCLVAFSRRGGPNRRQDARMSALGHGVAAALMFVVILVGDVSPVVGRTTLALTTEPMIATDATVDEATGGIFTQLAGTTIEVVTSPAFDQDPEVEALLEFYEQQENCDSNAHNETCVLDWNATDFKCSWHGIECDVNQKVIKVDLFFSGVTGTLPDSWSAMTNLEHLNLEDNSFTGSLPQSWSALINLQTLYLSESYLNGTLPEAWSTVTNLHILDLSDNSLSGTLPESWSTMARMETMLLNGNDFTGAMPESWSAMTDMETMYVNWSLVDHELPDCDHPRVLARFYCQWLAMF